MVAFGFSPPRITRKDRTVASGSLGTPLRFKFTEYYKKLFFKGKLPNLKEENDKKEIDNEDVFSIETDMLITFERVSADLFDIKIELLHPKNKKCLMELNSTNHYMGESWQLNLSLGEAGEYRPIIRLRDEYK